MKRMVLIILCCLLLTACHTNNAIPAVKPTKTSTETTKPTELCIPVNVFVPDENAVSFETIPTVISKLDAEQILDLLIEYGMLNEGIKLNNIALEGTQLNLDFNRTFLEQLNTYGTTGERMMIGSVVNTFLSVYDADTVYITVEGEIMESGHVIYDFPIGFIK